MIAALLLTAAAAPAAAAPTPPTPPVLFKVDTPNDIVARAGPSDWVDIAAADLLVMDLAADRDGNARRVVIQLMPAPFSQSWVGNIRKLAAAHWWDGTSINRVQDNYVVQWGDANAEDKAKAKVLPASLGKLARVAYVHSLTNDESETLNDIARSNLEGQPKQTPVTVETDPYTRGFAYLFKGWPLATDLAANWPVHCYGMVGVGRDLPPDTGSGAELYTVIGHAPRHLDGNIALVGRVIAGIEHLSSLPRGTGALGFYEKPEQRVTIASVRIGSEVAGLPRYQYLSTESAIFARYADARANRRDAFFVLPAGGADICNIPVPIRVAR